MTRPRRAVIAAGLALATLASATACGKPGGEATRRAFCAGLAFDYPTMIDHLAEPVRRTDSADASAAFLAGFYTDDFAAGAPDQTAGRLVVEGAQQAVAGNLERGSTSRYRDAFEELEAAGSATCPS